MDKYAINEKKVIELRKQLVTDIRDTLKEKGYGIGDRGNFNSIPFVIECDRLLIDDVHTDFISVDGLLSYLREACKIIPNYKY